ncbi:MAG: c-type cytochrome domain-containing protein [Pirellulales bacterium]
MFRPRLLLWLLAAVCGVIGVLPLALSRAAADSRSTPAAATLDMSKAEQQAFFKKKVEPVLRDHCYGCHSSEAKELKGELRLDTHEGLRKGAANGPAIVPGDPDASFLLRSMRYTEDDYKMPPRGKLDDDILRDLETWIKSGAEDTLP